MRAVGEHEFNKTTEHKTTEHKTTEHKTTELQGTQRTATPFYEKKRDLNRFIWNKFNF